MASSKLIIILFQRINNQIKLNIAVTISIPLFYYCNLNLLMKSRLKSHKSDNSQSKEQQGQLQSSKYVIPRQAFEQKSNGYSLPEEIQYKLQKVFQQSANREANYISLIKSQEQSLRSQQQKYLEALKGIKQQFLEGLKGQKKGELQWMRLLERSVSNNKKREVRLNSNEFVVGLKKQIRKRYDNNKLQPVLSCQLTFYYFTSFIQDYIRQTLPQELVLILRTIHPHSTVQHTIQVIHDQDPTENIHYLRHRIPFQIATKDNQPIIIPFTIPCQQDPINHYKTRQFQLQLVNQKGLFTYAYSKFSLSSILYYQEQPTEWHANPLPFYCPLDGKKVCEISWKMNNKLQLIDKNEHYKIQSKHPMEIKSIQKVDYNDDESRMVQRISQFKTNTNSLLLGIGNQHNTVNSQKYFESENEKIVIMHRHKKELQSIAQYKSSHKQQLMGKLFNRAIEQYYLTQCQVGCPKYILFNYQHTSRQHQKLFLRIQININNAQGQQPTTHLETIRQSFLADLLNQQQIKRLQQRQLISISSEHHLDYDLDEQEKSVWALSGMTHPFVIRFICLPLKPTTDINNLQAYFQIKLTIQNQYNQILEAFHSKIKLKEAAIENQISLHGYCNSESLLDIPLPNTSQGSLKKILLSNLQHLEYKWNSNGTGLALKIYHSATTEKTYYLIVNDKDNLYQIKCLELKVFSYPILNQLLRLPLGEIRKISIAFTFDETTLTSKNEQMQALHGSKAKHGQDQIRVGFASSKPEHCVVECENQSEVICKLYKSYNLDVKIQSFNNSLNPEKILIHAVNLDEKRVIKRWLVEVLKDEKECFKQAFKLSCEHAKPIRYKLELYNQHTTQKSYRFYSSNLSILRPPLAQISLLPSQSTSVELQFCIGQEMSSEDLLSAVRVILSVREGEQFVNYLYEIMVRMR